MVELQNLNSQQSFLDYFEPILLLWLLGTFPSFLILYILPTAKKLHIKNTVVFLL